MTKKEIIDRLGLEPLPSEGGWFFESYRSALTLSRKDMSKLCKAPDYSASTAIFYMLGADDVSGLHSVANDETWHFYEANDSGTYIDLISVSPAGVGTRVKIGSRLELGQIPQFTVPAGHIMGARLAAIGRKEVPNWAWVLCGTTVSPSFEYEDFVRHDSKSIAALCPKEAEFIMSIG